MASISQQQSVRASIQMFFFRYHYSFFRSQISLLGQFQTPQIIQNVHFLIIVGIKYYRTSIQSVNFSLQFICILLNSSHVISIRIVLRPNRNKIFEIFRIFLFIY